MLWGKREHKLLGKRARKENKGSPPTAKPQRPAWGAASTSWCRAKDGARAALCTARGELGVTAKQPTGGIASQSLQARAGCPFPGRALTHEGTGASLMWFAHYGALSDASRNRGRSGHCFSPWCRQVLLYWFSTLIITSFLCGVFFPDENEERIRRYNYNISSLLLISFFYAIN